MQYERGNQLHDRGLAGVTAQAPAVAQPLVEDLVVPLAALFGPVAAKVDPLAVELDKPPGRMGVPSGGGISAFSLSG